MDPGLVDVEWADAEGGGLRKSVLEAVSRVRFESVLPVRRFMSYCGQRRFTGWYWAATTESLVCPTRGCRHTFREQVPGVLERYERRITRLISHVTSVGRS